MTGVMAANQGLYNGFLAAGLIWTFFIRDVLWSRRVAVFFLSCVAVAGLYAAVTIELKVLFVQTVPAVTTMVFLFCMKLSGDGVMIKENVT